MALKDLDPALQAKLIERIQALFRLGDKDRNNSEAEAETATKKAQELLQKYNLDMSEVMTQDDNKTIVDSIIDEVAEEYRKSSLSSWEKNLLAIVGVCCECKPYISQEHIYGSKTSRTFKMRFIGTTWDVAIAKELYAYLHKTLLRNSRQLYVDRLPLQRSYLEGAAHRLGQRVAKQNQDFKDEQSAKAGTPDSVIPGQKYALMVTSKKDAINEYVENNLKLTQAKQKRQKDVNWEAYQKGVDDANRINLGTTNVLKE